MEKEVLKQIRDGVAKYRLTDDVVTVKSDDETVARLCAKLKYDWETNLDKELVEKIPFNVEKCIFYMYGYEYAKLKPDLNKYSLDYGNSIINVDLNDIKFIKVIYPTLEVLHQENKYTNLWRNINNKKNELIKSSIEDPDYDINFLAFMPGVAAYAEEIFDAQPTATFDEVLQIKNEEFKGLILMRKPEIIETCLEKVHTHVCKKDDKFMDGTIQHENTGVYTLFRSKAMRTPIFFVRAYDYSTDRSFLLGVEPNFTDASDAVASLLRIPRKIKKEWIEAVNRQGEKFSLYLTPEGEKVAEALKPADFNPEKCYYLTGKEYFSLMRYEY